MRPGGGIGLRPGLHHALIETAPPTAFLEAHTENYLGCAPALADLERLRRDYPVSLHSVGLSIVGADGPDGALLAATADLARRIEPELVSVHAAWIGAGGDNFLGLYPFPRTPAALDLAVRNVDRVQTALNRVVLVENLAPMMEWPGSQLSEPEFLNELARRSGCRLLLDVNNIVVGAANLGADTADFIACVAPELVGQYHLAGHRVIATHSGPMRIDSHDRAVAEEVWALFRLAVARFGAQPCTIERDDDCPPLDELLAEARRAGTIMGDLYADVA
jgi:uncharacterized protein (UPF0276 family)